MGAPPAAPRRRLFSADEDLEAVAGPRLRGEKNRVLDLYERCPEDIVVVCFDECGPLELRPLAGVAGSPSVTPSASAPSTTSTPTVSPARCASARPSPTCSSSSPGCAPATPEHAPLPGDRQPQHAQERAPGGVHDAHNIEPVSTPTCASWLNAIESHFAPLKKFAIAGTDDPSHEYRRWRIAPSE